MAVMESVCTANQQQPEQQNDQVYGVVLQQDGGGFKLPLDQCSTRQIGDYGEDLATAFLESCDLTVLERNWRCSFGEVDIIAEDDGTLVLVEVKTRVADLDETDLAPEVAVGYRKQAKYRKLALFYLSRHPRFKAVRFDVVAVQLQEDGKVLLRHLNGAYEWDD